MLKLRLFAVVTLLFAVNMIFGQNAFEDALKKASAENKRVVVDVYTDWCGWCKKMDAEAYSNDEVKKLLEDNYVLVKLNAEGKDKLTYNGKKYTEEELSYYFEVFSFPTTIFLEPDGKVISFKYDNYPMKNIPGYVKTEEFKKLLIFFRDGKYKDIDLSTVI